MGSGPVRLDHYPMMSKSPDLVASREGGDKAAATRMLQ
jgi:hypothetical protein